MTAVLCGCFGRNGFNRNSRGSKRRLRPGTRLQEDDRDIEQDYRHQTASLPAEISQPQHQQELLQQTNETAVKTMSLPARLVDVGVGGGNNDPAAAAAAARITSPGKTSVTATATASGQKQFEQPQTSLPPQQPYDPSDDSDPSQNFLRVARAGNLAKVLDYLNCGTRIDTCNVNGLNALHLASKEGHSAVVQELLSRGADPDACTKKGNTALHIASLAGQLEVVRLLISKGAKVNCQSQCGFTPLYMAAQENHLEIVKLLLSAGATQTLATTDGFTPLAVALQQGHDKVVALLLENDSRCRSRMPALHVAAKKDDVKSAGLLLTADCDPNHQAGSGFTALHIAAHYGSAGVAGLLLERGADPNYPARNGIAPLHVAAKWGMVAVAQKLLEKGANVNIRTRDGLTAVHCAARAGQTAVLELLLTAGAAIDIKSRSGLSALHMAVQGDHVDCARQLIGRGADTEDATIDLLTPLHVAAHCGFSRCAQLLLDSGCKPSARALNGFTPLHVACKKGRNRLVELLLRYEAEVNAASDATGLTPLHVAAFVGHAGCIGLLMQQGAELTVVTTRGETPLHLAAKGGHLEVMRMLIRPGVRLDAAAQGAEGLTALHAACKMGHTDAVVMLVQAGANPDSSSRDGSTGLHIAAREGHEQVALALLLEGGASIQPTTRKGATPLHVAVVAKNEKTAPMIRILLERGADPNSRGRGGVTPLILAAHNNRLEALQALLEGGADPNRSAANGCTPLHAAARRGHAEAVAKLLRVGADVNGGSTAAVSTVSGQPLLSPLHLAAEAGHANVCDALLTSAGAKVDLGGGNTATPLHLAAREGRLAAAEVLVVQHGGQVDPRTADTGWTPLHVASYCGQTDMAKFLIDHGASVTAEEARRGCRPLHLAAMAGKKETVMILLEAGAEPDCRNLKNLTPAHLAQQNGHEEVFQLLKQLTPSVTKWDEESQPEDDVTSANRAVFEEALGSLESGVDFVMLDAEEEDAAHLTADTGDGFTQLPASPIFSRPPPSADSTSAESGGSGVDSMTQSKEQAVTGSDTSLSREKEVNEVAIESVSARRTAAAPQLQQQQQQLQQQSDRPGESADNLATMSLGSKDLLATVDSTSPVDRIPTVARFLVSFLVDARGGSMSGARSPGLRFVVPPKAATEPTRITCRLLRPGRLASPPQLCDGEGLASRILELGPSTAVSFRSPVLLEVPHVASLRNGEREVVVYRSDTGDVWKEHPLDISEQAVLDALGGVPGPIESTEELKKRRVIRILTSTLPQYLALVTRIKQEAALIGPEGGAITSGVVKQVQAIFPEGALTKKIRVAIQVHPMPPEVLQVLDQLAASPIVTIEPRRRKFHKPITLTIPLPPTKPGIATNSWSLRLMCSITGGSQIAVWEDITGSTPLSRVRDCVSFTTTVSARFWLFDCPNSTDAVSLANRLYRECLPVPYVGRFVVYAKRNRPDGAKLRCLCVTDDKSDKTLECAEGYVRKAESAEVEVLDGRSRRVREGPGNLTLLHEKELTPDLRAKQQQNLSDQLQMTIRPFRENRLSCQVRIREPLQPAVGRVVFSADCSIELALPDYCGPTTRLADEEKEKEAGSRQPSQRNSDSSSREVTPEPLRLTSDTIARAELDVREVADCLRFDWPLAAKELGLSDTDVADIKARRTDDRDQAWAALRRWRKIKGESAASGNALEAALRHIGRDDVIKKCMRNVQYVTEPQEKKQAKAVLDGPDGKNQVPSDELTVVPQIDERKGPQRPPPTTEELEAARQAKVDAFLNLTETLEQLLPDPELRLQQGRSWDGAEPVEEESISAHSRQIPAIDSQGKTSGAAQVEELLSKLDSLPDQSMAPEAVTPEEVVEVPKTVTGSHTTPTGFRPEKPDGETDNIWSEELGGHGGIYRITNTLYV